MYLEARKLGRMSVPSVQGVKGIVQGRNSEILEETHVGIYYSVFGSTRLPNHTYIAVYFPLVLLQ